MGNPGNVLLTSRIRLKYFYQCIVSLIIGLSLLFGHAELRDDVDLDGLVLTDLAKPGAKLACQNSNYPKNSGPSHLQH